MNRLAVAGLLAALAVLVPIRNAAPVTSLARATCSSDWDCAKLGTGYGADAKLAVDRWRSDRPADAKMHTSHKPASVAQAQAEGWQCWQEVDTDTQSGEGWLNWYCDK